MCSQIALWHLFRNNSFLQITAFPLRTTISPHFESRGKWPTRFAAAPLRPTACCQRTRNQSPRDQHQPASGSIASCFGPLRSIFSDRMGSEFKRPTGPPHLKLCAHRGFWSCNLCAKQTLFYVKNDFIPGITDTDGSGSDREECEGVWPSSFSTSCGNIDANFILLYDRCLIKYVVEYADEIPASRLSSPFFTMRKIL